MQHTGMCLYISKTQRCIKICISIVNSFLWKLNSKLLFVVVLLCCFVLLFCFVVLFCCFVLFLLLLLLPLVGASVNMEHADTFTMPVYHLPSKTKFLSYFSFLFFSSSSLSFLFFSQCVTETYPSSHHWLDPSISGWLENKNH